LENFNLILVLLISFNYTCNCLITFNFMQFHHCQIQLSAPKFSVFSNSVIRSWFIQIYPQLTIKHLFVFNLAFDFSPWSLTSFTIWSLVLNFFNQVSTCLSNLNNYVIKRGFITLSELRKMFHMFSNSSDCKSLRKVEWDLKRVSNLIQRINDYGVVNKHDLT
jgi:hypothetical protein